MTTSTDTTVQAVFISEEYTFLCHIVLLAEGTTTAQIEQWWQESKGRYSEPLPGEVRRDSIIWKHDLEPETGWTPVDETWPHPGQVFHLLDREVHTYDPTEYKMPEDSAFVHTHMDDDSFLRLPDGTCHPHPDYDPSDDDSEDDQPMLSTMLLWGMTSASSLLPTYNNRRKETR
ncbi:MAG: hypothetical protein CMJ67_09990 [Planctomycetaceae bacterium]|nr:hypothetical protein [Planctomycetaceae bacterium]